MGRGAGGDDDDEDPGSSKRVEWVKERLLSTYPKLAGAKFDKSFYTEEILGTLNIWFESEEIFCLFVPESLKIATQMPKKLPKGKSLLLIKNVATLPSDDMAALNKAVICAEVEFGTTSAAARGSIVDDALRATPPPTHRANRARRTVRPDRRAATAGIAFGGGGDGSCVKPAAAVSCPEQQRWRSPRTRARVACRMRI